MTIPRPYTETTLEKYLRSRPLFTTQVLIEANTLLRDIPRFMTGKPYIITDIDGKPQQMQTAQLPAGHTRRLNFQNYHSLSANFDSRGMLSGSDIRYKLPYYLTSDTRSRHSRESLCYADGNVTDRPWGYWQYKWITGRSDGKKWTSTWDATNKRLVYGFKKLSSTKGKDPAKEAALPVELSAEEANGRAWKEAHLELIRIIKSYERQLQHVDTIIAFALGSLTKTSPRPYVQHLSIVTIRDTINEMRIRAKLPPVNVILQDPEYCSYCRALLAPLGLKNIYTDLSAFFHITNKTLVVSISPSAPILQIVCDLAAQNHACAPAAILCNEIETTYTTTPRHDDQITRNIALYIQNCSMTLFGDARLVAGMTNRQIEERLDVIGSELGIGGPLVPAKLKNADEGVRREVAELNSAKTRINFADLGLYVRMM